MFNLSTDYIVEFDIAAIILTLMLFFTLLMRRTFPTAAIKWYKHLLLCNILSSVADLISAYTICNSDKVSIPVNYVVNISYFLFHNITAVFFMMYVIAAIRKNTGTKRERILWICLISVISLMSLTTPFTRAIFYFDADHVYRHGLFLLLFYATTAVSILYSMYLIFRYRASMSAFQIGTDFAFILLVITSIIFQKIIPHCLIENFIIAIACVMMDVALDNPATYFYKNSSCYNQTAFDFSVEARLKSRTDFALAAFVYNDLSVIKKQLGENEYEDLIQATVRQCQKLAGRSKVFFIQNDTFAIMHDIGDTEKLIGVLEASLTNPVQLGTGKTVTVVPHFCVLHFPGEARSVNEINLVIQDTLTHIYRKTGEHIIRDSTRLLKNLHRQNEVVHRLRDAIRNDGITVMYQPMLNRKTGKFTCMEALVRLRENPENIYPDEFISIAENNGLIFDIGERVLEHVCSFLRESGCMDHGIEKVNVNLSMLQLINRTEVERLVSICRKYGISPAVIMFEVTETAAEGDGSADVRDNIGFLKESGFSISLDDYGSGYSNLSNLIRFSFDQVKIDKNLLWSAVESEESLSVLENVIQLVNNFGMNCVVEGVENDRMEQILSRLNVDYLQGYKYSRPITAPSLVRFLKDHNL